MEDIKDIEERKETEQRFQDFCLGYAKNHNESYEHIYCIAASAIQFYKNEQSLQIGKEIANQINKEQATSISKQEWYGKLKNKLLRIQSGELKLEDYILEITGKANGKPTSTNQLEVTLLAFSELISGNTIFMPNGRVYEELEKVAIDQIVDFFDNDGKNWCGYTAFKDIKQKYVGNVK